MSLASAAAVDPPNDRAAGNRPSNQPAIGSRKNNANDFYFGKIIGEGINLIQSKYYKYYNLFGYVLFFMYCVKAIRRY